MSKNVVDKYLLKLESNNLYENIKDYFSMFQKEDIFNHTLEVVEEVKKLADIFNVDKNKCVAAAYLHDVGRVVNNEELILFCNLMGQVVEDDERIFPPILHQKASRAIAEIVFKIEDNHILNSIECHTTLKGNPSEIDMAVFLADKLSWKEEEYKDLITKMRSALEYSKESAILYYQENLHNKRESLKCYHSWSKESYEFFKGMVDCTIT